MFTSINIRLRFAIEYTLHEKRSTCTCTHTIQRMKIDATNTHFSLLLQYKFAYCFGNTCIIWYVILLEREFKLDVCIFSLGSFFLSLHVFFRIHAWLGAYCKVRSVCCRCYLFFIVEKFDCLCLNTFISCVITTFWPIIKEENPHGL